MLLEDVCYNQHVLLTKLGNPSPSFSLYSKAKVACYSRYLLTFYFCIPIPYDEKDFLSFFFFLLLVLEGLLGLQFPVSFNFFGISGWGVDLHYHDAEWCALEMN